jgi:hypothetical protein
MGKIIATLKSAWAGLQELWASLPHPVQAGIVMFTTAAGTTLGKELQALWAGNEAFTWLALKHDIGAAVAAGFIALRAFYMLPNGTGKRLLAAQQAQDEAKP